MVNDIHDDEDDAGCGVVVGVGEAGGLGKGKSPSLRT